MQQETARNPADGSRYHPGMPPEQDLADRLRSAEEELASERRRAHLLRVVLFLAFVALCTAMTVVLSDRPSYSGDHVNATIRECIKVLREHASPDTRKQAIWIGMHQCVLFIDELRSDRPREVFELGARDLAIAKLRSLLK